MVSATLYPLLLLLSIPLIISAVLTTISAFSTLLFRVLLVYADLAAVLIQNQLLYHYHRPSKSTSSAGWPLTRAAGRRVSSPQQLDRRRRRRRSSSDDPHQAFGGGGGGGSRTPKSTESNSSGLGIYSAGSMHRDFEGVGGWRIPNAEGEDDVLWTSMNSRLELPAFGGDRHHHHHHRRSITSGGGDPPLPLRARPLDPYATEPPPLTTARSLGTTSPQEYFVTRHTSKSTPALHLGNAYQ